MKRCKYDLITLQMLVRDTWEIIEAGATMIRPSLIKILIIGSGKLGLSVTK
jgi:hypothetical protein